MGIRLFGNCCTNSAPEAIPPNPDPSRWTLIRKAEFYNGFVLEVKYDGCTNYEGRKIMVYRGNLDDDFLRGQLDPHFKNSHQSPIARFRPDEEGWESACLLAEIPACSNTGTRNGLAFSTSPAR